MLASIAPTTNDFHALARYLVHGKPGTTPHPDRVAWVLPHNIPTDEPERAARIMEATAGLSARTRKAAYHVMIAWHEKEVPTPEQMQEVAVKTLGMVGLGEHQALIMGHGDRPHRHLHMLINRVHPVTGKAWHQAHDYARFDAIMRDLSDAYGFLYVPAHTYNPEQTSHKRKKPNSRATYAAMRGARTNLPQWSREESEVYGARISEDIDAAASWDDLAALFARNGHIIEPKGAGWIVGNQDGYAKLSALRLDRSAKAMPRLPSLLPASLFKPSKPQPIIPLVDVVDIAKGLAAWGLISQDEVRSTIAESIEVRQSRRRAREAVQLLDKLVKLHLLAATSLKPPRPRQHAATPLARSAPNRPLRTRQAPPPRPAHLSRVLHATTAKAPSAHPSKPTRRTRLDRNDR